MQQLSGVDASFLSMETPTTYGHICNVVVLEEAHDGVGLTLGADLDLVPDLSTLMDDILEELLVLKAAHPEV